jgi:hypothetical protein
MTAIAAYLDTRRLAWFAVAAVLFVVGFAIDGTSEPGHHAALILGGIVTGWNLKPRR